jgi:hypothetical protein
MGDWYKNQHDLKTDQDPLKFQSDILLKYAQFA